jgi:hypothetical protein
MLSQVQSRLEMSAYLASSRSRSTMGYNGLVDNSGPLDYKHCLVIDSIFFVNSF